MLGHTHRMALASLADRSPVPAAEAAKDRSAPGVVSGRLKCAMDALIYEGSDRATAAKKANMSEHSLYAALRKPHVLAYYREGLEVLRNSEQARSIHRLAELRDQNDNKMVAFNAAKELAGTPEDQRAGVGMQSAPGLTVVINVPIGTPLTHAAPLIIDSADGSST